MKKGMPVLLCGLVAVVATIILYFAILSNVLLEAIHIIVLLAIVLAEVITTAYAYFIKGSPRRVAAVAVSSMMIPVAVLLSVIYIVNFPYGYGTYLGWYFAATIIVNAVCVILLTFDSRKKRENDSIQEAKSNMLMLRKMVKCVIAKDAAQPYHKRLMALEEELHFNNDCMITSEDAQIQELLLQLQEGVGTENFNTEEFLTKLEQLVKIRKITTSRNA